jgi:histidinol-phosphate aminotransferase
MAISPGAEVVVPDHAFVVYTLATITCGGTLVRVPAAGYGADLDAMLAAVTPSTAAVFLANPNNPTGTWVDEARLVRFLDALPERVWMVLDEAYFEYVSRESYPDGVALLERYPNLIVTRTFSKVHGLAALRVGYALSSPAVADLLNRARQPFNVNSLGLAAAEAALGDAAYVAESRALNDRGMVEITTGLESLGLDYIPSLGNFVAFAVPARPGAPEAKDVYERLLHLGVIVRPIAEYGLPRHLRVSIGLPEENARFLEALGRVLG